MKRLATVLALVLVVLGAARPVTALTTATKPTLVKGTSILGTPDVLSTVQVDGPATIKMSSLRMYSNRATEVVQVFTVVNSAGTYQLRDRCGYSSGATHLWTVTVDNMTVASALLKCA